MPATCNLCSHSWCWWLWQAFLGPTGNQLCPYPSVPDALICLLALGHLVTLLPCTDMPHPSSQCGLCRSEQGHAVPGEKQAGACRDEGPQSSSSASKLPSPKTSLCKLGGKKHLFAVCGSVLHSGKSHQTTFCHCSSLRFSEADIPRTRLRATLTSPARKQCQDNNFSEAYLNYKQMTNLLWSQTFSSSLWLHTQISERDLPSAWPVCDNPA